jgi:hypothetical protein
VKTVAADQVWMRQTAAVPALAAVTGVAAGAAALLGLSEHPSGVVHHRARRAVDLFGAGV